MQVGCVLSDPNFRMCDSGNFGVQKLNFTKLFFNKIKNRLVTPEVAIAIELQKCFNNTRLH